MRVAIVSALLAGGLLLGGCTTDAPSTSSASTSASSSVSSSITTEDASTTATTISSSAEAAQAFLATLSDEQREQVTYDYDDETKTTSWSNFPVTFVDRAGVNLADLSDEQRAAAMKVLEALLSDEGYATVTGIMGNDKYLHEKSSSTEESLGQYYIAFFGDPSDSSAWEVQFGGHHLGINATLDGAADEITFAPTHLGIQPAVYTDSDGNEVQPFDGIYTTAFAFYDSLTDEQKAALYQGSTVANMVCAPGSTCDYPTGTGISGADLTDEQKKLLLDVIANWVGLSDEETTSEALAEIEATLDETYINWSGATAYDMTQGDGIYFQISGPDVYIEFAAQQGSAGADVEGVTTSGWGHVHTIYRDPGNDYAGSVTQQAATGMAGGAGGPGGQAPAGSRPASG
ncbi:MULTISPECIES: DUF3500 domain-containing protein [unclassified Gordonia (in: high G+C Gram-positive bacteria)]|uniref:DUF3500 domain-containing protein n=1 Tax=unclassified Gordonia (in: high G+C Gram-positive bacteria) TaxID=2657482 RepID=UPI0032C43E3A